MATKNEWNLSALRDTGGGGGFDGNLKRSKTDRTIGIPSPELFQRVVSRYETHLLEDIHRSAQSGEVDFHPRRVAISLEPSRGVFFFVFEVLHNSLGSGEARRPYPLSQDILRAPSVLLAGGALLGAKEKLDALREGGKETVLVNMR